MAVSTVDLVVTDEAWVEVASSPTTLLVKPDFFAPWWVCALASGTPNTTSTLATGSVNITGLPSAAETVTINGQVYTFRASVSTTANEVKIGADANTTGANLAAAINGGAGAGTVYGSATVANTGVTASNSSGTVTCTAIAAGTGGNAVTLAESATNVAVSGGTLSGAVDQTFGIALGKGLDDRNTFESGAISGKVFIRVSPAALGGDRKARFGIIKDV